MSVTPTGHKAYDVRWLPSKPPLCRIDCECGSFVVRSTPEACTEAHAAHVARCEPVSS